MSGTFEHDSLFGGLNLLKRFDNRFVLGHGERPPYPIMISNPSFSQVSSNLNKADFGVGLFFTALGYPFAKYVIRGGPGMLEYTRRSIFTTVWSITFGFGVLMAFQNSYYRLSGHVENGLRWRRKEQTFNQYDFTSEYERNTIWGFFRLRK